MHPELFTIPFTSLTVKSYGLMLVIGFLAAVWVIKRLTRDFTPRGDLVLNAGLYALIAGLVGSRIFYVLHHFGDFRGNWLSVFAVWRGGLELLGGGLPAMLVILIYLRFYKLPARKYMDAVAIGLLVALSFGRIGCFLNGCCFGKPTDVVWAVHFPYNSPPYQSQAYSDPARHRDKPYLTLPDEYYGTVDMNGTWMQVSPDAKFSVYPGYLKPREMLTPAETAAVTSGPYRCLAVHPTQLYESAGAAMLAFLLYLCWRWEELVARSSQRKWYYPRQGYVFAFMLILYGAMRFGNEMIRDDNPFEFAGLTISQSLAIFMVATGVVVLVVCQRMKPVGGFIETVKAKGRK